jgi:hypothetical protein
MKGDDMEKRANAVMIFQNIGTLVISNDLLKILGTATNKEVIYSYRLFAWDENELNLFKNTNGHSLQETISNIFNSNYWVSLKDSYYAVFYPYDLGTWYYGESADCMAAFNIGRDFSAKNVLYTVDNISIVSNNSTILQPYSKEELKKLNSANGLIKCVQCNNNLKIPWPGIQFCPICEP